MQWIFRFGLRRWFNVFMLVIVITSLISFNESDKKVTIKSTESHEDETLYPGTNCNILGIMIISTCFFFLLLINTIDFYQSWTVQSICHNDCDIIFDVDPWTRKYKTNPWFTTYSREKTFGNNGQLYKLTFWTCSSYALCQNMGIKN